MRSAVVTATVGLLLASSACSSPEKSESSGGAIQLAGADAFPKELKDLCARITKRTVDPSANPGMVIVQDGSQSVLATKPPTEYAEQIRALSVADGASPSRRQRRGPPGHAPAAQRRAEHRGGA